MDKNKKNILIGVGVIAIVILVIFIISNATEKSGEGPTDIPQVSASEDPTEAITETPTEEATDDLSTDEPESSEEPEVIYDVTDEDIYNIMDDAVDTLIEYTSDSTITNRLISNGGHLYSINTDKNVDPSRVFDDEEYSSLDPSKIEILYVIPNDILEMTDIPITAGDTPDLFFAYKFSDHYVIGNDDNFGGELTMPQYNALMAKYTNNSDDIVVYSRSSPEFMDMEFLAAHQMGQIENGVATRYAAGDGKYGFLITSPANKTDEIHAYLYKMGDEGYDLLESNVQEWDAYEKEISLKYPDFNNGILPDYDLDDFVGKLQGDVSYIANSMGVDGNLVYGCGYRDLYYMEFDNGQAFVLVKTSVEDNKENYEAFEVKTTGEARQVLEQNVKRNPPYIILKQY